MDVRSINGGGTLGGAGGIEEQHRSHFHRPSEVDRFLENLQATNPELASKWTSAVAEMRADGATAKEISDQLNKAVRELGGVARAQVREAGQAVRAEERLHRLHARMQNHMHSAAGEVGSGGDADEGGTDVTAQGLDVEA